MALKVLRGDCGINPLGLSVCVGCGQRPDAIIAMGGKTMIVCHGGCQNSVSGSNRGEATTVWNQRQLTALDRLKDTLMEQVLGYMPELAVSFEITGDDDAVR